jgi:hypothetical protein
MSMNSHRGIRKAAAMPVSAPNRSSWPTMVLLVALTGALTAIAGAKENEAIPTAPTGTRIGTVSGAALIHFCGEVGPGGAAVETPTTARCVGYFQGVIDALESLKAMGAALYCLPDDFTAEHGVHLFKQEAETFPQVLDRPASDLVAGMFAKFFPC